MRDTGSFSCAGSPRVVRSRAHLKNELAAGHQIAVQQKRLAIRLAIQRRRLNVDVAIRNSHAPGLQTIFPFSRLNRTSGNNGDPIA